MTKRRTVFILAVVALAILIGGGWYGYTHRNSPRSKQPGLNALSPSVEAGPIQFSSPEGASPEYYTALENAKRSCSSEIQLLYVLTGRADGKGRYTFLCGQYNQSAEMEEIDVAYDSNTNSIGAPTVRSYPPGRDDRQPINLADWKITSTGALNIALANGGKENLPLRALQLHRVDNSFVWNVTFGSGGYFYEIRVDATSGNVIGKKGFYPTI